ncbi:unnamed protein product [Adineta ricciae]|uniref:DDE-1 domain-containing protein n=1 Tax=Adineta ricciae TaxID=249248 RepID=A0A815LYW8_ADIRI|nr:unnamed protein product [Adineta ricciae]CAF1601073.1 unnamed protein product [Adineta ricciae]
MVSTHSKRCTLSIEQKLGILDALKSKRPDDVAKDFNINYSTVKKIRQNEEEIGGALIAWFHQPRTGAENWINNVLPGVIKCYGLNDVFNADETGLFYTAVPSGTLSVAGSHPTGNKTPKDRITVLFLCNSTGTEKKAYAIGKSKHSRCFKKAQSPLPYYSNANAWRASWIWSDILQKFDREFGNRKILLFADTPPVIRSMKP